QFRAIAAAGNDRRLALGSFLRCCDDLRNFVWQKRKEFAGAACGEEGRGPEVRKPADMFHVGRAIETPFAVEVRDGKRKEASTQSLLYLLRIHGNSPCAK